MEKDYGIKKVIQNKFFKTTQENILRLLEILVANWHIALTVIILTYSGLYLVRSTSNLTASDWGSFFSGVSSSLAFVWLIKGMHLQAETMRLQSASLDQQTKELANNARFASLSQVESILDRANEAVCTCGLGITKPVELTTLFVAGTKKWKNILESSDSSLVMKEYAEWVKIEGIVRQYVTAVAHALRVYVQYNTDQKIDLNMKNENIVYIYSCWGEKVPFLSEHTAVGQMVAQLVVMFSPVLESLKLAGLCAAPKAFHIKDAFKDGYLEGLRDQLEKNGCVVPVVALSLPRTSEQTGHT